MTNEAHKTEEARLQHNMWLPESLARIEVEDIVRSIQPLLQSRYYENIFRLRSHLDWLRHVQRRRPQIYLDFHNRRLLRRCNHPKPLPPTLVTTVLAWLLRNTSVDFVDFHLLPRTKQNILSTKRGNLRKAFTVNISKLRKFVSKANLPIEIAEGPTPGRLKVQSYVSSNIGEATEIAEHAQRRLESDEYKSAIVFTEQALKTDPDCKLAVSIVHRFLRCRGMDGLYPLALLVLNSQTHTLLAMVSNISRISTWKDNDSLAEEIIAEAHRRIALLEQRLRKLWSWLERSDRADTDTYSEVLYFIGQAALAMVGRGDMSYDDAFQQLVSQPSILQSIHNCVLTMSPENSECLKSEIEYRFWRLLFVDGWLPTVVNSEGFVSAFQDAMRSRFRVSNTPDGAAKIPGAEYRDDWFQDKEEDADSEPDI